MANRYVEPSTARHSVERIDGVEQIRVPVRRQWYALVFIAVWLILWTIGGIAAMSELARHFEPFLVFWLSGWAIGWLFAALTVAGQIGGSEVIRVVNRDLEVSSGVGLLRRTWHYRGDAIHHLASHDPVVGPFQMASQLQWPIFWRPRIGAVKFDYGASRIFLSAGVDEPEGRMIVDWIARRLPASAGPQ
ncbi:MAG: hypothetical protein V4564_00765 [Pseudomonadota bacterium]